MPGCAAAPVLRVGLAAAVGTALAATITIFEGRRPGGGQTWRLLEFWSQLCLD